MNILKQKKTLTFYDFLILKQIKYELYIHTEKIFDSHNQNLLVGGNDILGERIISFPPTKKLFPFLFR